MRYLRRYFVIISSSSARAGPPAIRVVIGDHPLGKGQWLAQRLAFITRPALLIIDKVGYLLVEKGGANLFFQLINAQSPEIRGTSDQGSIEIVAYSRSQTAVFLCRAVPRSKTRRKTARAPNR